MEGGIDHREWGSGAAASFPHTSLPCVPPGDPLRPLHPQHGGGSHGRQDGGDRRGAAGLPSPRLDRLQELVQAWSRLCHPRTLCHGGSSGLPRYSPGWGARERGVRPSTATSRSGLGHWGEGGHGLECWLSQDRPGCVSVAYKALNLSSLTHWGL